jgi:glycosyltransferase involved in cell wall biosynthesis
MREESAEQLKISFIVPVYNVPRNYLSKCISSLLSQSGRSFEIIIIDDGSTRDCADYLESLSSNDSRITLIHQPNSGLSAARNHGVRLARGRYISFVDGDDWLPSNFIEVMYPKKEFDIVFGKIVKDFGEKKKRYKYSWESSKAFYKDDRVELQRRVLDFKSNISTVCGKLFSHTFLVKNALYHDSELRHGSEGIEFNFRAFGTISSAYFVNEYVYNYVYDNVSLTNTPSYENAVLALQGFEKIQSQIHSQKLTSLQESLYTRVCYLVVTTMVSTLFNPQTPLTRSETLINIKDFLEYDLVKESCKKTDLSQLDFQRRTIIKMTQRRAFFFLKIIGRLKSIQNLRRR